MRSASGFSLVELLVAMAIMATVAGAVLVTADRARHVLRMQPERADLQQRLRVAIGTLQRDLMMAGAGPYIGRGGSPLHHVLAPVLPYRGGDRNSDPSRGVFYRSDAVSVMYVPSTAGQAVVERLTIDGGVISAAVAPNCGADRYDRVCGFTSGTPVLLLDVTGQFATGVVEAVEGAVVRVATAQPGGHVDPAMGARLVELSQHTYWLEAGATPRLMHYDGRRTDSPAVDHVVALRFEYFGDAQPPALRPDVDLDDPGGPWTTYGPKPPAIGRDDPRDSWPAGENCAFGVADGAHVPRLVAFGPGPGLVPLDSPALTDGPWCPDAAAAHRFDADLLRIRRVRILVRLQAADGSLRGRGRWFTREGTARSALMLLPDQEILFDVAPRNLNLGR
jgi:prepilin-type N-terminal cleavage/methylation domain-containing protein